MLVSAQRKLAQDQLFYHFLLGGLILFLSNKLKYFLSSAQWKLNSYRVCLVWLKLGIFAVPVQWFRKQFSSVVRYIVFLGTWGFIEAVSNAFSVLSNGFVDPFPTARSQGCYLSFAFKTQSPHCCNLPKMALQCTIYNLDVLYMTIYKYRSVPSPLFKIFLQGIL